MARRASSEQDEHFYTTHDLAERYRTSVETVRYWRRSEINKGPKWVKIGREVLYPKVEVERFDLKVLADAGIPAGPPTRPAQRAS